MPGVPRQLVCESARVSLTMCPSATRWFGSSTHAVTDGRVPGGANWNRYGVPRRPERRDRELAALKRSLSLVASPPCNIESQDAFIVKGDSIQQVLAALFEGGSWSPING
jgi:hypothetical protein